MNELFPLIAFGFVAGVTPGPNNTLLMISGANWGFRATLPLLSGIVLGFPLMIFAIGMGLNGVFVAWPVLHTVLKVVGVAYMLVLAWKVARSGGPNRHDSRESGEEGRTKKRPLNFFMAVALQWVNPKGWMIAVTATSVYLPSGNHTLGMVSRLALVFLLLAIPCSLVWCVFGTALARFLDTGRRIRVFNATMAVLLVLSLIPILF